LLVLIPWSLKPKERVAGEVLPFGVLDREEVLPEESVDLSPK